MCEKYTYHGIIEYLIIFLYGFLKLGFHVSEIIIYFTSSSNCNNLILGNAILGLFFSIGLWVLIISIIFIKVDNAEFIFIKYFLLAIFYEICMVIINSLFYFSENSKCLDVLNNFLFSQIIISLFSIILLIAVLLNLCSMSYPKINKHSESKV